MKLTFALIICILYYLRISDSTKCELEKNDCDTTDYKQYVDCVRRTKRSLGGCSECDGDCESPSACDECDCSSCEDCSSYSCDNNCCNSCCNRNIDICRTNHCCHKTCHAKCQSSYCRKSCRKSCYDIVKQDKESQVVVVPVGGSGSGTLGTNTNHNITTIIHLNNLINNTNLIDVPITLNNTNINNISISSPDLNPTVYLPGGNGGASHTIETVHHYETDKTSPESAKTNDCCTVVSPRQCVPSDKFPFIKCFHYRTNQCGPFCNSPIVHVEPHNVCDTKPSGPPECHQQLLYIPQPQPRCVYQSVWPYVSCSAPNQMPSCEGCYTHYADSSSTNYQQCSPNCYDEGYDVGPLYRQGPVFRPSYSPYPFNPPGIDYSNGFLPSFGSPGLGYDGFVNPESGMNYFPYNTTGVDMVSDDNNNNGANKREIPVQVEDATVISSQEENEAKYA